MSRKDMYHETVKQALIRDGWYITDDPLYAKLGTTRIYVDLGAKTLLEATKAGRQIAVEIKSFIGRSQFSDFHTAVGQYMNYRLILAKTHPQHELYLALTETVYNELLDNPFGRLAIAGHQLKLILFDESREIITQWID